jgi:alpha-N-arabinofuranosidase
MVKMANYKLLTFILGRDMETGNTCRTPFFYMFRMYANDCLGQSVDAFVSCDTFNVDEFCRGIPYLDVSAVCTEDKQHLIINVVNRHREDAIETEIVCQTGTFSGKALVKEIFQDDPALPYSCDRRNEYEPKTMEIPTGRSELTRTFPPHSFTQITVALEK